ncbi:MAG: DUF1343 domain-containing protein [bacterium]
MDRYAHIIRFPTLLLLTLLLSGCGEAVVMTGADRLARVGWEGATGLPAEGVGVITNHTGRLSDGTHLVDALLDEGVGVAAVFSPEHGFTGDVPEGARVYAEGERYRGVPIHSLYGVGLSPTEEMLEGIRVLVYDIQDVGARFYTYTSTLTLTLETAAARGIPYVILDRPDPIGGLRVEGPVLEEGLASFVGRHPIPVRYALTPAEYVRYLGGEGLLEGFEALDLRIVPLQGWRRRMLYPETGVPWVPPSPNMPTPATALVYPGTCLVEGTTLSEGRGTERPFELIGAPWADGEAVAARLAGLGLPGVVFRPAAFTPGDPSSSVEVKWKGRVCSGVEVVVTDPDVFPSFLTGVAVVSAFRRLHPEDFYWREAHFDRLAGVRWLREGIEAGLEPRELAARWEEETAAWAARSEGYRIYP